MADSLGKLGYARGNSTDTSTTHLANGTTSQRSLHGCEISISISGSTSVSVGSSTTYSLVKSGTYASDITHYTTTWSIPGGSGTITSSSSNSCTVNWKLVGDDTVHAAFDSHFQQLAADLAVTIN